MLSPRHGHDEMSDGMGYSGGAHGGGGGGSHMSVFNNELRTALYSDAWTPSTAAGYAGTIIFLIFLAMLFRALFAFKAVAEARWLDAEMKRRYVVVQGKQPLSEQVSQSELSKRMTLSENGIEEDVVVVQRKQPVQRPFRLSVDPLRAAIDTVIAGVGYLLMLAVMTLNVGYFIAVLGGTFLGSLLVGRYYATAVEH
ncbi:Ctr copper transporter family-domain-containing protein [Xylariaceae sp. FL0594]|nr:Ctr copper transporter family-domain-containing protein [Xylariaceae sp. FL0594]